MTHTAWLWLIALVSSAGALLVYGAFPNQQLRPGLPPRVAAASGAAALLAALVMALRASGPAASVFMVLTDAMLVWSIAPLLLAWWKRPARRAER